MTEPESKVEPEVAEGNQSIRDRRFSDAIRAYQSAIERVGGSAELYEKLAMAYYLAEQVDEAIGAFHKVLEHDPRNGSSYINLGAIYNRIGNYAKAIELLRKGIQFDKKNAKGYYNLGIAHRKSNQLNLAIPAYKEAIRLNPLMAEAYQNLGNVYLEMGSYPLAIPAFKKALEIRPNFEKAVNGLAKAESASLMDEVEENPFGRLVDPNASSRVLATNYQLSEEERVTDRQSLSPLVDEVRKTSEALMNHIRSKFDPALKQLFRLVTEQANYLDSSTFDSAVLSLRSLSKNMHSATHELRKHEQRVLDNFGD